MAKSLIQRSRPLQKIFDLLSSTTRLKNLFMFRLWYISTMEENVALPHCALLFRPKPYFLFEIRPLVRR